MDFHWSGDGQSIFFIASNHQYIIKNGLGGDSSNIYNWKVYEASLDGSLTLQATTRSPIGGWWNGIYFITPIMGPGSWTWVYPDGSINTINPTKECKNERLYDSITNSYTSAVANFSQSSNGNRVIIASCPDGEVSLSWVNSTGTEVKPIAKLSTEPVVGYLDWVQWSQDDKFIAFNVTSSSTTNMYILNVIESIKNPSLQPIHVLVGGGDFNGIPSWQPIP